MENYPLLDRVVLMLTAIQVGSVATLSIFILFRYARHRSMVHISTVALSYLLLTALTAGSIIYKIFATEPSRSYAVVIAMLAFLLGDFALWKVWHDRNGIREIRVLEDLKERVDRNEQKIVSLEKRLDLKLSAGTSDDPIHVKVDGEERR
jgi:hypothetical protein